MNLVLTMAGKYTRFRLFGSKIPKYLLPLASETILSEVIKQLKFSAPACSIFLIANRHDQIFFPIVRSIIEKYEISSKALLYIDDTASQLETALVTSDILSSDQMHSPIAFANIDTITKRRQSFFEALENCRGNEGVLDTFKASNKQYSYARTDNQGKMLDIVDYNIISEQACSGLYGFGSYAFMADQACKLLQNNPNAGFTSLYKSCISLGLKISTCHTENTQDTIVMGTPEEYLINIHRFK